MSGCLSIHHIFMFLCICWQITWKEWHKSWHVDVSRWFTLGLRQCRWILFVISCIHLSIQPSMGLGLDIADKSLGSNGLYFGMLMYQDDLLPYGINADGYCFHFMRSSVGPTVHELRFWYCGQIAWKKSLYFWHADVSRRLTFSWLTLVGIIVRPSVHHIFAFLYICWNGI